MPLLWYRYAWQLIESSGLADFGLAVRPADGLATGLAILGHNLVSEWPELLLGYVPLLLLLVGLWRLVRQAPTRHAWFGPGLLWGVALASYYLLELHQMKHHTYYMLPLLPLLLLLAAWGAAWWWQRPRARVWLVALLALQPLLSFARIGLDRWVRGTPDVAPELLDPSTRAALEAATPLGAPCVVGPDESGCKDFYFLHKKGFGFAESAQLVAPTKAGVPYIQACISQGARYLYTNDTVIVRSSVLRPYLGHQIRHIGSFSVWELKKSD